MNIPIEVALVFGIACCLLGHQLAGYFKNLKKGKCGCNKCGGK